jgi:hypothetical protein
VISSQDSELGSKRGTVNVTAARELHLDTFRQVFQVAHPRPFGHGIGISDGNNGVQWNAGADSDWTDNGPFSGRVGVNLEGLTYDNWPIDRLIERELSRFSLFRMRDDIKRPDEITVRWTKDVWAGPRPRVDLQKFLDVRLSDLSENQWRSALNTAQRCLNRTEAHRRRGRQVTTVRGVTTEREVSPHLQVTRELWRDEPPPQADLGERMRRARIQLDPIYRMVGDLAKK